MKIHFEEPPIGMKTTNLSLAEKNGIMKLYVSFKGIRMRDGSLSRRLHVLTMLFHGCRNRQVSLPPDLTGTDRSSCSIRDDESSISDNSIEHQAAIEQQDTAGKIEPDVDSLDNATMCSANTTDEKAVAHATPVQDASADTASFMSLRITYLIVTLVVMLADGLQGTLSILFCAVMP